MLKSLRWFGGLVLLLAAVTIQPAKTGLRHNPLVRHFEPIFYDPRPLPHPPRRSRRSTNHDVRLQFAAHNRVFKLHLTRDTSVFSEDVVFDSTEGQIDFDISRVYTGQLEDDDESEVSGMFTPEGLFDGTITTSSQEEFFVEPASQFFDGDNVEESEQVLDFHSVIYRSSDVHFPVTNRSCASEQLFRRRMHRHHPSGGGGGGGGGGHRKYQHHYPHHPLGTSAARHRLRLNDLARHRRPSLGRAPSPVWGTYYSWKDTLHNKHWGRESLGKSADLDEVMEDVDREEVGVIDREEEGVTGGEVKDMVVREVNDVVVTVEDDVEAVISDGTWMRVVRAANSSSSLGSGRRKRQTQYLDRGVPVEVENDVPWGPTLQDQLRRRSVLDPRKTTCMLYLQADHLFYSKMGSIEACIETMTRHVQRVNSIYRVTDFDQDGQADNISFMIKRIKVHTPEALKDPNYRFPDNYGVEKFLELFSEEDYDAFCLAYMFTYRDFEGGTLGLAWTGDLKNAGGVCEKNGHYRGSLKSLNTGIVTLLNYGKHVPPAVSHVTLAHEIGHNFGSPHDPEDERTCTPGGEDGNYIMFARATSGDKKNNNKFSPCSLKSINAVLNSKARDPKGCFTEPQDSICGNEVVEKGEECDCGWEEDCTETCCWPMRAIHPSDELPCRLRPNRTCSPSQGPCCTAQCQLKDGDKCRDDNGCRDSSFCEKSKGPTCPPSTNKPNKTICNEEFVCYMGECTGSICIAYGLESCQCKRGPTEPMTKACELCCKFPGEDHPCVSSFEWNTPPYDIPDMFAKPGTPCDNYNGYCDVFQKCREVDPSGPLATLRKLLLSTESIASLKRWIIDHWWCVMLMAIGFIIVLGLVVKVFGKQPEPKAKAAAAMNGTYSGPSTPPFTRPVPCHAVTTALSRTNLPVATATAAYVNGHVARPPVITGNGWV